MKKLFLSLMLCINFFMLTVAQPHIVFSENMGIGAPIATPYPGVSTYTGFQNYLTVVYSGTADVRASTASTGSGDNNVFLTNNGTASFKISNINIDGASNMHLKFLLHKNTTAQNGSNFTISIAIDGGTHIPIASPTLTTGTGSTGWKNVDIDLSTYSGNKMDIQFGNTSTANSDYFRIDDVQLISDTHLPVTFGQLRGSIFNQQLNINWETLNEENTNYFEVQASKDGAHFVTIDKVVSKAVLGNSSTINTYSYFNDLKSVYELMTAMVLITVAFGYKNRKALILGSVLTITLIIISCNKNENSISLSNHKLFVRIVQVDKNNHSIPSKIIVVNNDVDR